MQVRAFDPGVCRTFATRASHVEAGGGADALESTIPITNKTEMYEMSKSEQ